MSRPDTAREQGFVLLQVLLTLVPSSLLISGMLSAARTETRLAANVTASAIVQAADGGIHAAIMWLLHNETADGGAVLSLRIGVANVAVRIDDEAGKLNPNVATVPQLAALPARRVNRQTTPLRLPRPSRTGAARVPSHCRAA